MLVFLSDFHLTDGSAGLHYLGADSFRNVIQDIADKAREAEADDITLVFLGDIYDLFRTERWFEFPFDDRPWGADPKEEPHHYLLEAILTEHKETFELFSGSMADEFEFPAEPKRVYIPGNHDRTLNKYPALRRRVRETLGMEPSEEPFPYHFLDVEHAAFARHGHEWDAFNFEGSPVLDEPAFREVPFEDYMRMPIGDPMTVEFATRVPILAREFMGDIPERDAIVARLRQMFDVRPVLGMVSWLSYQVSRYEEKTQNAINEAMRQSVTQWDEQPHTRAWMEEHDTFRKAFDEADRMQAIIAGTKSLSPHLAQNEKLLTLIDRGGAETTELKEGVRFANHAVDDLRKLDAVPELNHRIAFILYGHTHTPQQWPIDVVEGPNGKELERFYINTGTWRPAHRRGITRQGWVHWKNISYTIIYKPGEKVDGGYPAIAPGLEAWVGTLNTDSGLYPR